MTEKLKDLYDRLITSSKNIFDGAIADEDFMKECVRMTCKNTREVGLKTLELKKENKLQSKEAADELDSMEINGQCELLKNIHARLLIGRYSFLKEMYELSQEDYIELEISLLAKNMVQSQKLAMAILQASEPELEKLHDELTEEYIKMIDTELRIKEEELSCGCPIFTIPENEKKDTDPMIN